MSETTVYDVALELARRDGWRNLTRSPLYALAKEKGIVPEGQSESNWCKNLRGGHGLSSLRSRVRLVPGVEEGVLSSGQSSRSGSWKDVNKQIILDTAYALAEQENKLMIPRAQIAEMAGVSGTQVNLLWGTMGELRLAIVKRAREKGNRRLVDQADAIGLTA
jgi:hypothetical protein